jgi:DNA-binding NarL/FixJ family response regulator
VRDYERAAQWCERSRQYGNEIRFGLLSAICRTQYASVLIWRGAWREAEAELDAAIRQLRAIRPPLEGEGTVRLARLRRLQGRLDEAEALLGASESHPHALAEQAALALDRGDAAAASRLGERFLRQTNPADVTERVQGHEVLLRARLGQGDRAAAQAAVDELRAIAQALDTNPLRASVRLGEGLLAAASGAHHDARRAFEDAADLYRRSGAPLETARARLELAGVLRALGQTEAARAEVRAAREAFAALGAARDARRAEALGGELERPARGPGGRDPRSHLTPREVEVLRLVAEGLSNAQIAARLHVSEFTVKRHVANILSTLELPTRAAAAAYTVRNQLA